MINHKLFFTIICPLGLGCLLLSLLYFLTNDYQQTVSHESRLSDNTTTDTTITSTTPSIIIKDITLREVEKKKGYELIVTAQESSLHNVSDTVECNQVTCKVLQHGNYVAALHSQKSFIDRIGKHITLAGLVNGVFKDLMFQGSDIHYNFSTQVVTTDKNMTYTHPHFRFSANQSAIDISTQKIQMAKGVWSEFLCCPTTDKNRDFK